MLIIKTPKDPKAVRNLQSDTNLHFISFACLKFFAVFLSRCQTKNHLSEIGKPFLLTSEEKKSHSLPLGAVLSSVQQVSERHWQCHKATENQTLGKSWRCNVAVHHILLLLRGIPLHSLLTPSTCLWEWNRLNLNQVSFFFFKLHQIQATIPVHIFCML